MRTPARLSLCFLGASWLAPVDARALGWRVPDVCPDADEARSVLLAQHVAPHAIDAAEVVIEAAPRGQLRARVSLQPHDSARTLYADACPALADAILLVISLGSPQVEPQPSQPRDAAPGRLALSASGLLDVGTLPNPGFGAGAALGSASGRVRVELYGGYWPEQSTTLASTAEGRAGYGFYAIGARSCVSLAGAHTPWPRWPDLGPCAGVELGRMHGQTSDIELAGSARGRWGAALFGLMLAPGPWRRLTPLLQVDLTVPFLRPVFEVEGLGAVHRAAPLALRVALGLRVDLMR